MAFSKAVRQSVYEKYGGRCAYCGRKIEYNDLQVDHFVAKRGWNESGSDDFSNLMPACRMCQKNKERKVFGEDILKLTERKRNLPGTILCARKCAVLRLQV